MIVNGDFKGLEVVVAADWYQDQVLMQEVRDKVKFHDDNQARFKLPDRVTAKRLMFKTLYGGSPYGFAKDGDFVSVGYNEKQWAEVLDAFYDKYKGVQNGHARDISFVKEHGYLEIPSGRYFNYRPTQNRWGWKWPETTIKNYPIQGFGADLVKLGRIEAFKQFKASGMEGEFIGTIHDSIVFDIPGKNVDELVTIIKKAVDKVPEMCYDRWSYKFSLPMSVEIQVGPNKADLVEYI